MVLYIELPFLRVCQSLGRILWKERLFLVIYWIFWCNFCATNCVKIQILRASNSLSNFTKLVTVKLFSFIDFTIFFHLQWKVYKVWLLRIKKGFKLKAVVTQQVKRYTDVCNQNRCSLHKPYWNRGILNQDYIHQKSFQSFGLWSPYRYEIDLSNEVLNIDFDQEVAKIPEVKVGVCKKHLPISLVRTHVPRVSRIGRYFFQTPTLTFGIFAAPWSKSMFSTSFERSIY